MCRSVHVYLGTCIKVHEFFFFFNSLLKVCRCVRQRVAGCSSVLCESVCLPAAAAAAALPPAAR